jgi:hypothetical protein
MVCIDDEGRADGVGWVYLVLAKFRGSRLAL